MRFHAATAPWWVLAAALACAACKPWTVRPIEDTTRGTSAASGRFDAGAYVSSVWTTRVLEAARTSAVELKAGSVAGAGPVGAAILVRGAGTVVRVDSRSRVGLALVDLAPADGRPDVALQIGPVLRGTTVRDALPFVRFGDFANQLEFADVANALNAQVLRSVLTTIESSSLEGRMISFWGAMKIEGPAADRLPEVVPVILERGLQ